MKFSILRRSCVEAKKSLCCKRCCCTVINHQTEPKLIFHVILCYAHKSNSQLNERKDRKIFIYFTVTHKSESICQHCCLSNQIICRVSFPIKSLSLCHDSSVVIIDWFPLKDKSRGTLSFK